MLLLSLGSWLKRMSKLVQAFLALSRMSCFSHTCGVHFDVLTVSFSTPAMFFPISAQKLKRKRSTRKMMTSTWMPRTRLAISRMTACGIMEDSLWLDVFIYICTLFRPMGPFVPNSIISLCNGTLKVIVCMFN